MPVFNLKKLPRSQLTTTLVLSASKYVFLVLLLINVRSLPFAWHSEYAFVFASDESTKRNGFFEFACSYQSCDSVSSTTSYDFASCSSPKSLRQRSLPTGAKVYVQLAQTPSSS